MWGEGGGIQATATERGGEHAPSTRSQGESEDPESPGSAALHGGDGFEDISTLWVNQPLSSVVHGWKSAVHLAGNHGKMYTLGRSSDGRVKAVICHFLSQRTFGLTLSSHHYSIPERGRAGLISAFQMGR